MAATTAEDLIKAGIPTIFEPLDGAGHVPFSTYVEKVEGGLRNYATGQTYISAVSPEAASDAVEQITELLRDRHHVAGGTEDDFQVRNMVEVASP